jgi:hypothetical protein
MRRSGSRRAEPDGRPPRSTNKPHLASRRRRHLQVRLFRNSLEARHEKVLTVPVLVRRVRRGPILVRRVRRGPILVRRVRRGPILVRPVLRGPILVRRVPRGPILVRPVHLALANCRGNPPSPSYRPNRDPRTHPGTIVGTDRAGLERRLLRLHRPNPSRRPWRLSLPRCVRFSSLGQVTQRRSALKLLDVQPFSIRRISLADPISATRKSHGRGLPRQSPAMTTALVGVRTARPIRTARRRFPGTPSRSPVRIWMRVRPRSSPVIVAASPVPIGTPTWVPEVAWAPLREGVRLSLSLRRSIQTGQPKTGGHRGRSCYRADDIFHIAFLATQAVNQSVPSRWRRVQRPWPQ